MSAARMIAEPFTGRHASARRSRTPYRTVLGLVLTLALATSMLAINTAPAAAHVREEHRGEPSYCPYIEAERAEEGWEREEEEWRERGEWPPESVIFEEELNLWRYIHEVLTPRPGIDWSGCNLEGFDLEGADLEGADLSGANLEGAVLFKARLSGGDLTGVFGAVRGGPASLPEHWKFVREYFRCDCYDPDYGYLVGPGADLYGAELYEAELYEADLAGADLYGADLYEADLYEADLAGADLARTDLEGVSSGGIVGVPASLPEHWMLVEGYLIGPKANLKWAELQGADLRGADLAHANLERTNLEDADLEGANLTGDEKALGGALRGANLTGDDLASFDLEGAELQGADLTGADLTGADLESADLQGANLTGANLVRARLEGVSSGGIVGVPASLPEKWMLVEGYLIGPEAELNGADLHGADLHGADLEEADLEETDLRGADLTSAYLAEAFLTGAYLEGADLEGADLAGAYLEGANLTGANLTGVAAPGAEWTDAICPDGKNASLHIAGSCLEALAPLSPTVETGSASSITSSSATLNGAVNPNGEEVTSCVIEYGTSAALAAASSMSCGSPGSGTSPVPVSVSATGLSANTTYYFRVDAENASGKGEGTIQSFTTLPNPPTVVTGSALSFTQTTATVGGSVNPNGGNVTSCVIEYGTTLPSVSSVPCNPPPGSGTSEVSVSASISGLTANTTYEYQVVAENAGGKTPGGVQSFTTLPNPPTVETGSASSITSSSATLSGSVNPNGGEVTSCVIEYGTSAALAAASSMSCGSPGSGTSPVPVSVSATGLTPNTTYYFRVKAKNAGGETPGGIQSFTTRSAVSLLKAPTVETGPASSVTHTSATLSGSVNPNGGKVTSCVIEHGVSLPSGTSVPCTPSPGSGTVPVGVSGAVGGLAANTAYEYRLIATNAGGTSTSATKSFTTAPIAPPEFGRCVAVQAGHGRFSSSKCTSEGGKGGYEWAPGALKTHFTFSGGAVKLETASKESVTCAGVSGQGSYGAFKELTGVTLTFTGCQSTAGKCSATGASAGEVQSAALTATLVWTSNASKTIALDFMPSSGNSLFGMQCGSTSVTVDGSVLVPVKTDKASATSALAFKASKGAQKPTEYEASEGAKAKDALEVSFAGGPAEPIGLTTSITQTSEEPVEISSTI